MDLGGGCGAVGSSSRLAIGRSMIPGPNTSRAKGPLKDTNTPVAAPSSMYRIFPRGLIVVIIKLLIIIIITIECDSVRAHLTEPRSTTP